MRKPVLSKRQGGKLIILFNVLLSVKIMELYFIYYKM